MRTTTQGSVWSPVLFNVFLQATIDEVNWRLELAGISGGMTRAHYDGNELKWPPAGRHTGDILLRWLTYADDICILAESKTQLSAILNIFNDVLTHYGIVLSVEKPFWIALGRFVDVSNTKQFSSLSDQSSTLSESFKYLGVVQTSELTDMADIDKSSLVVRASSSRCRKYSAALRLTCEAAGEAFSNTDRANCVTWLRELDTVSCCV